MKLIIINAYLIQFLIILGTVNHKNKESFDILYIKYNIYFIFYKRCTLKLCSCFIINIQSIEQSDNQYIYLYSISQHIDNLYALGHSSFN